MLGQAKRLGASESAEANPFLECLGGSVYGATYGDLVRRAWEPELLGHRWCFLQSDEAADQLPASIAHCICLVKGMGAGVMWWVPGGNQPILGVCRRNNGAQPIAAIVSADVTRFVTVPTFAPRRSRNQVSVR